MTEKYAQIIELDEEYTIILPDEHAKAKHDVLPILKAIFTNKANNFVFSGDKTTIYRTIKNNQPIQQIVSQNTKTLQEIATKRLANRQQSVAIQPPRPKDVRKAGSEKLDLTGLKIELD